MDWFEEWFDSPLYAKLYSDRDEEEARQLITFLEQTVTIDHQQSILDLGCGRGRHAINLAREGFNVTGIDLSKASIKKAKAEAKKKGLKNVTFQVHDMRNSLDQQFDVILNLFTSFGYFISDQENASVLKNVAHMLRAGGIFVLDFLNAHKVRTSFSPADSGSLQDIDYTIERYVKDNAIHKDIHFKKPSTGEEKTYSERVKLYELDWFKKQMGEQSLTIDHVYGDYEGHNFDPEMSPRLLILSHLEANGNQQK